MDRLHNYSTVTIGLIRKLLVHVVRDTFFVRFGYRCPKHLHQIRDLSLLLHLLHTNRCWMDLRFSEVASLFEKEVNDFEVCLYQLCLINRWNGPDRMEHPVGSTIIDFRINNNGSLPTRMRSLFSWNVNSWRTFNSNEYKLRRCKRLLRKGPVCLQETKWTGAEVEHLYQQIPGIRVSHSAAVRCGERARTGGVAVLLPPGWEILEELELVPGRAVAVKVQDRTCQFLLISVYIHPERRKQDAEALLRAWRRLDRTNQFVFLAGDFNGIDTHLPDIWQQILLQFECADVNPSLNTFKHAGGWSALDRCLVPESLVNTAKLYPTVKTLTSHAAQGHEVLSLSLQVRPNVLNHPAHPKHDVIPSGVFMPGKDGTPVNTTEELQQLIRLLHREHGRLGGTIAVCSNCSCALDSPPNVDSMFAGCLSPSECQKCGLINGGVNYFPACRNSYLTIASCFWSWWRMQPVPRQNPHIKPYCRARKYLRSDAQWINVPNEVATDLVKESRSAVIAKLDVYQQVNGCYALPRMRVQEMLEVIDRCIEGIPYVPLDEANAQARGLGNMVAFWERMRNICPKVNSYYGPVYGREGKQCVTSLDLDEAMLATRDFWFLAPTDYDNSWTPVLEVYEQQPSWPILKPPEPKDFLATLLHTKDSAPGPDGIPYSAWRLLPCVTVDALISYFYDIIGGTALPPMQVGVWIPKAKAGPNADHFRPLGMPNTIDRLVDGSVAAYIMRHTAHLMHPSQAVMSYFKEPQKAVSCIQRILDGDRSVCVLLADLSKAFERVNPYWILALLRIKKAPGWLIAYTKFVLFHRRVTHKVQGRLLPSRTLRQGVDMGRSFSVYLFCLAMDPLFTYLNQIPGVLAVQGYVDDTTIAGDGQDLAWIGTVESCYQDLQTAGFVIDPHACYFARIVINNRAFPHKCLSASVDAAWSGLLMTQPFPTARAALLANKKRGYNTVLVRKGTPVDAPPNEHGLQQFHCMVAVYTFQQINEIDEGSHMHRLGSFATIGCICKSKSHILCNAALRSLALRRLEATRFGIQAIRPHAPSLGLALEGRVQLMEDGSFDHAAPRTHLEEFNPAPARKMFDRLKSFSRPTLSIVARCTGYNTFILSVMPFSLSYFGLTSKDLNWLRQAASKYILKRKWIEAEILPYILRYVGITTLLDPALSAAVAALGLYLREGNPLEDLHHSGNDGRCSNSRQRAVVQDLIKMWHPYVLFEEIFTALTARAGTPAQIISNLKKVIISGMVREAKSRLAIKISREGWRGGIDHIWVELVAGAPKRQCGGIARYTFLRWAVNQDDDVWLSMRGTRHQQKCVHCGLLNSAFPFGHQSPPMCENCIQAKKLTAWSIVPWSRPLLQAYTSDHPADQIRDWQQSWQISPTSEVTCRACGCSDNTIGHWTRWCPVPLIVAFSILRPTRRVDNIGQLARMGVKHAVTCTLVLASFRRLLRQEGAFLHQTCSDPKDVLWWITALHEMVATDSHIELGVEFPTRTWAMGCCSLSAQQVSLEKVLPLDYSTLLLPPLVGVCSMPVSQNAQVAVLPLQSPILSALRELERTGTNMESNVQLKLTRCSCGEYHMCITACRELCKGDVLVPDKGGDPKIIVQFDGSAHRESQVGGAGAALLQFDGNGLALLDWDARVLPKCADNIVAEANGADLAMHLYEKYVRMCHEQGIIPLPLSRIHGDIKQLLHHLDFRNRFRRSDLIPLINTFHRRRSRAAPNAITEYRPRETNAISDYLAGQASAWIRDNRHDPRCSGEPFSLPVDPPYELLLEANAVILGPHVDGKVMLILQEMLGCNQLQLAACLRWNNGSHVAAIRCLALATRNATTPLTVEYLTPAKDASGRFYATQICAQKLPRDLRLLIYGSTHKEVDLTGAHYELIRAMTGSVTLPPTLSLRSRLKETWFGGQVADSELLNEVKMLPIRIINSGAARALKHVTDKGLSTPTWIEAFAFDLDAAREVFTAHVRKEVRPNVEALAKNRHFFAAEAIEAIFMQLFLLEVRKRTDVPSIIWLHDGLWIGSAVDDQILYAAERHVRQLLFPNSDLTFSLFSITSLYEDWQAVVSTSPPPPHPPLFGKCALSTRRGWRRRKVTRLFPVAKFCHRQASKRKLPGYIDRINKRARTCRR